MATTDLGEQFATWATQTQAAQIDAFRRMWEFRDEIGELSVDHRNTTRDLERERRVARLTQEETDGMKGELEGLRETIVCHFLNFQAYAHLFRIRTPLSWSWLMRMRMDTWYVLLI